jgi:TonB-linked SusC/RagA family outer membrane protein
MKKGVLLIFLLLVSFGFAYAQTRTVNGTVLDETGAGKPGVAVSGKGTQTGTVTDPDGKYELELPGNIATLVFRAVGYTTTERLINADEINVTMQIATTEIEGVVVTANAVRREKRSLGYSTTQVTGNDLTQGGNSSPLNALAGKVAGANISSSANAPGSSSRIVLRGGSSILGNNQALIVVDGVPINNNVAGTSRYSDLGALSNQVDYGNRGNDINPDDIESVTVLKGPAATALYGSAGSNGALMITTKKGKKGTGPSKTDIEVSSRYELSSILKYPEFQDTYGQGNIYEGIYDDRRENFSWGEKYNGELRPWGQMIDGKQRVKPYAAQPDNMKDFFDIGQTWNNNIAINGGTDVAAYRLSLGALNSKSIFPGKRYDKYNIGFNGNAKLSNKFYSNTSLTYTNINSDLPGFGQGSASAMDNLLQGPRDIPITELKDLKNKFNSMSYLDSSGVERYGYYGAYANNPYYTLDQFKNENKVDRIYGQATIGFQPFEWLRIENRLAGDIVSDRRTQSDPKIDALAAEQGLYDDLPHTIVGRYAQDIYNTTNIFNDLMAFFNKDIAKDFNLNAQLGLNYTQYRTENTYTSTNEQGGLVTADYYNFKNSNGPLLAINDLQLRRKTGVYADVTLGYRNMLYLGLMGRRDVSSTIQNRTTGKLTPYFYPGVNASFVFTELMQGNFKDKVWNYGKLRMSYGRVGNDADPYSDQNIYTRGIASGNFGSTTYPFGGVTGYSYGNALGLPGIQPEFTNEFEIGVENAFWNNRVTLDVSWYSKNSENQIIPIPIAPSSGFTSQYINTGLVTNKGIEIAFRVTPVRTASGFRWDLYGTYAKNKNEVKELFAGVDQVVLPGSPVGMGVVAAVGKPYGTFYTTGFNYVNGNQIVVDSASGLPEVSATSQYYGAYIPNYQASLGTTLTYKGFSLNVLFDTKQGGMFYSRTRDVMSFVGTSKETEDRDKQVWENSVYLGSDGEYHTNTTAYSPYTYFTSAGQRPESQNLVNATYVKLREASVTYVFPKKWFNKTYVGGASVSLYGNNLAIWTPSSNKYVDPEVNSSGASNLQGFDFSAQPSLRRYGINVKFTF